MRTGLDGPPVVAGRERERVNTVHDALVVRRRPVRVGARNIARENDPVTDDLRAEVAGREARQRVAHARRHDRVVRQVAQDAQRDLAAAEFGEARRQCLAERVDQVGTHGVGSVDQELNGDDFPAARQFEDAGLDVPRAAAALEQAGMYGVR